MISPVNVSNSGAAFGELQKSRREQTIDPTTGRAYTQQRLADVLSEMIGQPVSRSRVAAVEAGDVATPDVAYVNALVRVLPITGLEAAQAIGYDVEAQALREDERELLAAFRRLRADPRMQETALAVVRALPVGPLREPNTPRRRRR
jgi:hypothetical protein